MTAVSRRGLLTLFRGKPPAQAEPSFSLGSFYQARAARGEVTGGTVPRVLHRAQDLATETSSVGVSRAIEGFVRIRERDCLAYSSFCSVCSERCPVAGAVVIELGRPRVDPERCDGCGICVGVCPAPVNAFEKVAREARE